MNDLERKLSLARARLAIYLKAMQRIAVRSEACSTASNRVDPGELGDVAKQSIVEVNQVYSLTEDGEKDLIV